MPTFDSHQRTQIGNLVILELKILQKGRFQPVKRFNSCQITVAEIQDTQLDEIDLDDRSEQGLVAVAD
jgi:hypothetical protein